MVVVLIRATHSLQVGPLRAELTLVFTFIYVYSTYMSMFSTMIEVTNDLLDKDKVHYLTSVLYTKYAESSKTIVVNEL